MSCALCDLRLPKNPVREGEHSFCCAGCLTVFAIIGKHENFSAHPLFQEALKAGVVSNPELHIAEEPITTETLKFHLELDGLWCPFCADAIRMILLKTKGVLRTCVDYATDMAVVTIDPCLISKEKVIALIQKLGYGASELLSLEKKSISRSLYVRFAVAAFCSSNIMMFSYPLYAAHFGAPVEGFDPMLGWLSFFLTLPLISYAAWPLWKRVVVSFKSGLFGMETLVFIGVMTGFALSSWNLFRANFTGLYFDSLSMVLSFTLFGKILEKKAKFSAKETYLRLTHFLPKKGCKVQENGEFEVVPLKEIACGDILFVRTGEKIVLDGEVIEGQGLVDEMIMTGEALPVQKKVGAKVVAGSIVRQGSFRLKVTKDAAGSALGQIISLVEHDLAKKNQSSRLVHQITRTFVFAVLVLAALCLLFFGPVRALTVLLISCPCALGIAAPLAESRLFFRFAERGALVRNRNRIAVLGQNPLFVFDKTGTLTEGKFKVLKGLETISQKDVLKTLVTHSNHPISAAISEVLQCVPATLDSVQEIVGRGLEGRFQDKDYYLGSARFLEEKGIQIEARNDLETVVYFAENRALIGKIHLGDQLKTDLPQVEGVILSGDAPQLVASIAQKCGLLWGKGGLDPLQKRGEILALKKEGRPIVMVGDGVNDAPALTAADLGISVISATDLAVEVSDILLTTEHLSGLPDLCKLARKGQRIISQNLFWAFFYNSVAVSLAFFGLINPLLAAFTMLLSSLFVIANSYRL